MENIKDALFSERSMKIVNLLIFLSLLFRKSAIIMIAYLIWIAYLIYGIRTTSSKTVKTVYFALSIYAAAMIVMNLVFLIRSL